MRFEVPQFIDIEDHVVGPLTLPQFLYIAGGGGAAYIALRFLPSIFILNIIGAIIAAGFGLMMAFFRINGRAFPVMLFAMLSHYLSSRMYIWSYSRAKTEKIRQNSERKTFVSQKKNILSEQKLSDIAWSLDVLNKK